MLVCSWAQVSTCEIDICLQLLTLDTGTETTATELSGLIFYLLKNPQAMKKLVSEIREKFSSEQAMAMEDIARLEYLHACLEESLRLYPPVPIGLPRIIPAGGATICGKHVPGGVRLNMLYEMCTDRAN